jgi:hypothetical protein
LDWDQ